MAPRKVPEAQARSGWVRWVYFGGILMLASGIIQFINGMIVLTRSNIDTVPSGLLVQLNLTGMGWSLLIAGVIVASAGAGVLTGRGWARMVGIAVAVLSILANISLLMAEPAWSTVVILLDLIVVYALIAHRGEAKRTS